MSRPPRPRWTIVQGGPGGPPVARRPPRSDGGPYSVVGSMPLFTAMWQNEIAPANWSNSNFGTDLLMTVIAVAHRYGTHGMYLVIRSLSNWIQHEVRSSPD